MKFMRLTTVAQIPQANDALNYQIRRDKIPSDSAMKISKSNNISETIQYSMNRWNTIKQSLRKFQKLLLHFDSFEHITYKTT